MGIYTVNGWTRRSRGVNTVPVVYIRWWYRITNNHGGDNRHPTVKPHDLMRYLCRLVTPPGGLVLDPFCGSGSTGRAAVAEGFRFVGVEMDEAYVEIARARISAEQKEAGIFA